MLSIFCLGASRTGTSSLVEALRLLGYRAIHGGGERFDWDGWQTSDFRFYDDVDAIAEFPAILFWEEISRAYPACRKWILTVRDEEKRLASAAAFEQQVLAPARDNDTCFRSEDSRLRCLIVERWGGTESEHILRHNYTIMRAATHRHDVDLLVMDITKGDGWDVLCPFLQRPIPPVPFPCVNQTKRG